MISVFMVGGAKAQSCNANGNVTLTSTPGVVTISDNSTTSSGGAATYSWITFYDANTYTNVGSVSLQPYTNTGSFTFSQNGSYGYYLEVMDSITNCYDSIGGMFSITGVSVACDASFTAYPDSVGSVYFQASTNSGSGYSYYWDFGDGNSSNAANPFHTYNANGTYNVCLTVWNGASCSDTVCNLITIATAGSGSGNVCDASAMIVDTSGYLYGIPNVYSANYDYYWDFGDGNTSTQPYPWHQYANAGTYNVCLTVVDSIQGCSDTQCYTYVSNAPVSCNANFYLFQDSVNAGVYYAWNMSSGNNLTYFWDFGDGNTSTQAYPIHTYSTIGIYQLCLTVTDGSCSSTYCDTINVVVKSNGTVLGVSQPGQFAGIEDVSVVDEMSLYPNPNNGQFNLNVATRESGEFMISIMNYVGQLVEQNNVLLISGQNIIDMDLTTQPKGVYIINISDVNSGVGTNIKLIKE